MFDSFRRSKRPDLSQIHWFKRLTLIVLWFVFGASLAFVLTLQFFWISSYFQTPLVTFGITANDDCLSLQGVVSKRSSTTFGFRSSKYDKERPPNTTWFGWMVVVQDDESVIAVPGLQVYWDKIDVDKVCDVDIHHAWLISLTGGLYFFTRYRIRRAARKLSLEPSSGSHV
jgi:hypothetical protein